MPWSRACGEKLYGFLFILQAEHLLLFQADLQQQNRALSGNSFASSALAAASRSAASSSSSSSSNHSDLLDELTQLRNALESSEDKHRSLLAESRDERAN